MTSLNNGFLFLDDEEYNLLINEYNNIIINDIDE